MSSVHIRERVLARYSIAIVAILLISFVYAVIAAQVFLWIWGVVALISLGVSLFVLYLFYRLVLAIEQIAYE